MSYEFTNNWFETTARANWDFMFPNINPITNALEIGAYEGASTCYLIDKVAPKNPFKLTVVDTWGGGAEHKAMGTDMDAVYQRYLRNLSHAIATRHPGKVDYREMRMTSLLALTRLVGEGKEDAFDFIYIDGSHDPRDVIIDAVLAFKLLKKGGLMIFDDYSWAPREIEDTSISECPRIAIDAFTHIYWGQFRMFPINIQQFALVKS